LVAILYMIITFGIFGTVLMMTQERMYEFGVIVAVGMKKMKLILIVLVETVLLTFLGVIIGVATVLPINYYFHENPYVLPGNQAEIMEKYGFESVIPFSMDYQIPLFHGLLIFGIALVISLYPIGIIAKLNPLKAMRG
jgi:ABC-type antimicrobial peptide transport system permease subunit